MLKVLKWNHHISSEVLIVHRCVGSCGCFNEQICQHLHIIIYIGSTIKVCDKVWNGVKNGAKNFGLVDIYESHAICHPLVSL